MADLSLVAKNNMKRGVGVFVCDYCATASQTFGYLPAGSLVTAVRAVVKKADGTASSTIDVKVGSTVIANEVPVAALGVPAVTTTPAFFATGGQISIAAGAVVPAGNGLVSVFIEFIEKDKTTGEYLED